MTASQKTLVDMLHRNIAAVNLWAFEEAQVLENNNRFVGVSCGGNAINLCLNNALSPFSISSFDINKPRQGLVLQLDES